MININDINQAAINIAPYIHRTPLLSSRTISTIAGHEVRLKPENLQRAGAFKIRGAMNKLLSIDPADRTRGVVAFSSGNHAQGVALAASILGCPATIIMPEDSMPLKVAATQGYNAQVIQKGVNVQTRSQVAKDIVAQTGATMVPPFDDAFIMAGQGTVGKEIVEDWADVATIVVPLGGGGLLSGIAMAATSLNPKIRVYGVEPAAGNDGQQSFRTGKIVSIEPPATIADGARTTALGALTFAVIKERVSDIVTVDDDALLKTIQLLALRGKLVVEPTGALAVAAIINGLIPNAGKTVAVISGGNIDPAILSCALTMK